MWKKTLLPVIAVSLCPLSAWAGGFSGRVDAGVLFVNQADNLSGRSSKSIDNLNSKPKSVTHIYPIPMFDLRYRDDALRNTYRLGTPQDEPGSLAVGVRHEMDKGAFDTSFFYSFTGKEWENPYQLQRTETDVRNFGFKAAWENIVGSSVSASYKVTVKDVDRDLSGDLDGRLRRDGFTHRLEANKRIRLNENTTLTPAIALERGDADGSANSYTGGSLSCALLWRQDNLSWTNKLSGSYAAFDETHPVFAKTRKEPGYSFSSMAVLAKPFGMERVSMTLGYIHEQTLPNLDFFAKRADLVFALAGYSF